MPIFNTLGWIASLGTCKILILWSFEKSERSLGDEDRLGGDREAVDPETI
jgi:hypothetical protein